MGAANRIAKKEKVLLVEGTHEEEFFESLLNKLSDQEQLDYSGIQIIEYGGKTCLRNYLTHNLAKQEAATTGILRIIAITRDADTTLCRSDQTICDVPQEAAKAFVSVRDAIVAAQWTPPVELGHFGEGTPRIGVFILPNNNDPGALEGLCIESVRTAPEMQCLDAFFACAGRLGKTPGNKAKSRVQAWLSLQAYPDLHLGRAAKKGMWPFGDSAFDDIKDFLRELARA